MGMTRKGKKALFIVVPATLLIALAVIILSIPEKPKKEPLKIISDHVDLQIRNVRFTEVGDTETTLEVIAEVARYLKKDNLALFEKPTVTLLLKDGRRFTMSGERGRLNTESRDVEIEGQVAVVSGDGDRFTTDRLRYVNSGRRIETEGAVVMENRSIRVSGVGMTLSLEEKKLALLSQVRATYRGERRETQ